MKGQQEGICEVGVMTELFWVPIVVVLKQFYVFVKTQNCTPPKDEFYYM